MSELHDTLLRFVEVLEGNKSQIEQNKHSIESLMRRVEFVDSHLAEIKHTLIGMAKAEESRQNLWSSIVKSPVFSVIVTAIIAGFLSVIGVRYASVSDGLPAVSVEGPK